MGDPWGISGSREEEKALMEQIVKKKSCKKYQKSLKI